TYAELAAMTGTSQATLQRAASGRKVPSFETVTAIATACGTVPGAFYRLWLAARVADRGRLARLRRPASPDLMTTRGALSEAMEYYYEKAGAPSLRRLQERAGGAHLLAVSSAARIVNREALPASRQQCIAFLTACGLTGRLAERWADAFDRITRYGDAEPATVSGREAVFRSTFEHVPLSQRKGSVGSFRTILRQLPGAPSVPTVLRDGQRIEDYQTLVAEGYKAGRRLSSGWEVPPEALRHAS
ncbi:helix-turn-helix domain-containing protein, partial [Streptomyces sp. NPDC059957]|uniref:helix-turn-helix domain-containing protein n=1 Tax=Streptomyces sp. NPDC059957 TaxID=3347016 RepID=UPI00365C801A